MFDRFIAPVYQKIIKQLLKQHDIQMIMIEEYVPGGYFNAHSRYIEQIPKHMVMDEIKTFSPVGSDYVLGLASLVNIPKGLHIPMFDFDMKQGNFGSYKNFVIDIEACVGWQIDDVSLFWWVKSSPTGLHVIGKELWDWDRYDRMLRSMERIDPLFAQWSIARRYGTLRTTAGGVKGYTPRAM